MASVKCRAEGQYLELVRGIIEKSFSVKRTGSFFFWQSFSAQTPVQEANEYLLTAGLSKGFRISVACGCAVRCAEGLRPSGSDVFSGLCPSCLSRKQKYVASGRSETFRTSDGTAASNRDPETFWRARCQ